MKMVVVTTVKSTFDVDTMEKSVDVDVQDEDGLSQVSPDLFRALLLGSLKSAVKAVEDDGV